MNRETAQWLLLGAKAFQNDKNLKSWEGVSRENFVSLLASLFEGKTFFEAISLLEQVVTGALTTPALPPNLAKLISDWERAKGEKEATRQKASLEVQKFIEGQKKLAAQRKTPIFPLAEAAKKAVKEIPLERPSPPLDEVLPQEVAAKLEAEQEGVAFAPVYAFLQPRMATCWVKKIVLAPIVKPLQVLDKMAGEELTGGPVTEWREALHEGLASGDVGESILVLEKAGLSSEDPKIQWLEEKRVKIKVFEQAHPRITTLLGHYHEFSKTIGRRQIFLPEINTYLPRLSQAPVWQKKEGYSWNLRQTLNRLGSVSKLYEKMTLSPGKTIIKFSLPDKFIRFLSFSRVQSFGSAKSFVYQKTLGALFVRLGKTTLGKGLKKGASWLLTKLGIQLGITAAGTALAPGVGTAIGLVVSFGFGIVKTVWKKLKGKNLAIAISLLLGAGGAFLLSTGASFLGVGLLALGLGSLAALLFPGITSVLGGALTGLAGGIASFFTSLAAIPASILPVAALVVGPLGAITVLSFLLTGNIARALKPPAGRGGGVEITPGPIVAPQPGTDKHLAEQVVYTLNSCGITKVDPGTWNKTEVCLENSSLLGKEVIVNQFKFSVFNVGPVLQCVGFVRGVMDAFGKDPGVGKNARDYLHPPPGYREIVNRQEVMVGDLAVWQGWEFGHIAVVVRKEGNVKIVVAQAWGNNGNVNLTETTIYNPSGFIRAK